MLVKDELQRFVSVHTLYAGRQLNGYFKLYQHNLFSNESRVHEVGKLMVDKAPALVLKRNAQTLTC